jgi:hypothetical protein
VADDLFDPEEKHVLGSFQGLIESSSTLVLSGVRDPFQSGNHRR